MEKRYPIIEKQIQRLKAKGLKFKNEEKARKIILRENHYNITEGYEDVFIDLKRSNKQKEIYEEETYFEELYAIYKFDRDLKDLCFEYIHILETNIKSYVAYIFSSKYGESNYLKRENFRPEYKYNKEFEILKSKINNNLQRNFSNSKSELKKFYNQNKYIPLYMLVKVFTFGNIVNFYKLMKVEDKQEIAQPINLSPYSIQDYLKVLNIVRNICAHGDILFNIRLYIHIEEKDCNYHKILKISKENNKYKCGINDLFAVMIIFKKLLPEEEFNEMFIKIERLLEHLKREIDNDSYQNLLEIMGFPNNYGELNSIKE